VRFLFALDAACFIFFLAAFLCLIEAICLHRLFLREDCKGCEQSLDETPTLKVCLDDGFDFARVICGRTIQHSHLELWQRQPDNRFRFTDIQPADENPARSIVCLEYHESC
jgi:hypothetical protein